MAGNQERARGYSNVSAGSTSLPLPEESGLSQPPSPVRVRGQRASLRARAPSYQEQVEKRASSADLEPPKLPNDELDEFGLPLRPKRKSWMDTENSQAAEEDAKDDEKKTPKDTANEGHAAGTDGSDDSDSAFESAEEEVHEKRDTETQPTASEDSASTDVGLKPQDMTDGGAQSTKEVTDEAKTKSPDPKEQGEKEKERPATPIQKPAEPPVEMTPEQVRKQRDEQFAKMVDHTTAKDDAIGGVSAASHQALAAKPLEEKTEKQIEEEEQWQQMRAYGKFDVFNDDGELVARGDEGSDDEERGGAQKGYTKLHFDDDAGSVNSMEEDTDYLFKNKQSSNVYEDDEDARDPLQQMQATKDLLTEGQRIAYVGLTRLSIVTMVADLETGESKNKATLSMQRVAVDSMKMWGQKMMVRLYAHMEIEASEQIMIEQLAQHGVQPNDLTPLLMQNARVKNPMAEKVKDKVALESSSQQPSPNPEAKGLSPHVGSGSAVPSPTSQSHSRGTSFSASRVSLNSETTRVDEDAPPAYDLHKDDEMTVQSPEMMPTTQKIDIDIRWTVLCDLFLVLIADSVYDSRSRQLLENVGAALQVSWVDICRFEKRVTDALEMQEEASREQWDEADNVENRRKMALKKRYMFMGLATVGGTLIIGLSAGLLAPVIGAGLASGFTAIGVAGTTSFMAGAGGAAIITTASATAGGVIAVRASHRRTGAVKVFEYRPLHNNKRVNLILTVSGWMNGKVDDVRLPFSTVDPIMGDIYSLLWEPDVLQSTGDTIRILATEALTQGLQQMLAATALATLMAGLSLPLVLSKLSYLLDNPWSTSLDRAEAAGLILADSLVDRNLGVRPITLVGFSLGARVIFSCLRELARKGASGLVQNVYLFGSPIVASKEDYLRARSAVAGRFLNGYATNDWILGYLFRATSGGIGRVAGLAAVEGIPGLENINVTHIVAGHMAYRAAMPKLLREVGWEVESDEFDEIEDPDPENHEARQRELIREIDTVRQQAEATGEKEKQGRWSSFWSKRQKKKGWETYDVRQAWSEKDRGGSSGDGKKDLSDGVLFDIDAIRRELESEQMEVRQLESTLPPIRVDMHAASSADGEKTATATAAVVAPKKEPTKAAAADRWDEYDEAADAHVGEQPTMTFMDPNTSSWGKSAASRSDPHLAPSPRSGASRSPSHSGRSTPSHSGENGWAKEDDKRGSPLPPSGLFDVGPEGVGYNAWGPEDDDLEQHGDEEVKMTFE